MRWPLQLTSFLIGVPHCAATIAVLSMVAERFKDSPSVRGIGVINEPSNAVGIDELIAFYRKAYQAIRTAGMQQDAVDGDFSRFSLRYFSRFS